MPPDGASAYEFASHERPTLPGSPYSPAHPTARRFGYAAIAVIMAMAASLSNAAISVNGPSLAGALGVTQVDISWLTVVYVAFNASSNLLIIKARMRFGVQPVIHVLLAPYIALVFVQLFWPTFTMAVISRAAAGFLAAGLSTLTIYNLLQAFPAKIRPLALIIAVGLPQLATPLARLMPVEALGLDGMRTIHLMELGLAFLALAASNLLPLPPTDKVKSFEPLDMLTMVLFLPAMLLLSAVLTLGRYLWWTDTPWLGWALVATVILFVGVILTEHLRRNPLLQLRWIGSLDIFRFCMVAMLVRLALTEQTFGSIGLLTIGGLNNDQLHGLFFIVLIAMVAGTVASAVLLKPNRIPYLVMSAALIIALGAWLDSFASSLTRPPQLYLSQALLAFGSTFFIGPALLYGFGKVIRQGGGFIVSFSVIFNLSQNIGGLAGAALLGSYQVMQTRAHALSLDSHLLASDPQVMARIAGGITSLNGIVTREANIAAFNDVSRLVMVLAILTAAYIGYAIIFNRVTGRTGAGQPAS
ncbi:MFS transporter [Asticcacaulis sp. 201]|uniref:MFS transporter n=1 Tax=Asticcacaulis sp. 201 TaxID=3028787 RepID=UPI002915DF92|nr:MFS transporter [Asticcacaulis sp. 201]MDV6331956.1 MFS transporter [Asticcacaulis sp. 201]